MEDKVKEQSIINLYINRVKCNNLTLKQEAEKEIYGKLNSEKLLRELSERMRRGYD